MAVEKESKLVPANITVQEVADIFASHVLKAKSDRKAAREFARLYTPEDGSRRKTKKAALEYLRQKRQPDFSEEAQVFSPEDQQKISEVRREFLFEDSRCLNEKQGNYSFYDRASLVFKVKAGRFNGLTKEERLQAYRDVGYTPDEINKITGKKLLFSTVLSTGLAITSLGIKAGVTVYEKIVPFLDQIPDAKKGVAVGAAIAINTLSYAVLTAQNLRLTKREGVSMNNNVTGLYFLSDRLLPNRARDTLTVGTPILYNIFSQVRDAGIVEAIAANPDKIVAGSAAGTVFNLALAGVCEIWMRKRGKGQNAKSSSNAVDELKS